MKPCENCGNDCAEADRYCDVCLGELQAEASYHATVVTRRGDRRIMGRSGTRKNLCGAAPTLKDVLRPDFRKMYGSKEWPGGCTACAQALGLAGE